MCGELKDIAAGGEGGAGGSNGGSAFDTLEDLKHLYSFFKKKYKIEFQMLLIFLKRGKCIYCTD